MRHFTRLLVVSAALSVVSAAANAADIHIEGTTSGVFSVTSGSTYQDLKFEGSTISIDTLGGVYSLGTNSGLLNNLGRFTWTSTAVQKTYTGNFTLNVDFTVPSPLTPSGSTYTATLSGKIKSDAGGIHIDFDNTDQTFHFGPYNQDYFTLHVNDVDITYSNVNVLQNVNGGGIASTVPAPGAMAAFAIGAMGSLRRKRRA